MKLNAAILCLLIALTVNLFPAAKAQVNTTDSLALVDLYNNTSGSNHWYNNTNWLTKAPLKTWYGVTVTNKRVTALSLVINGLYGTLPNSIGNLTGLTRLNLQSNLLTGAIPAEIGNLVNLTFLNFGYDHFSGAIPAEIGNLTHLDSLILYYNQLSGAIPSSFGNLVNLVYVQLVANQLSGAIPAEIGNLVNLQFLNLNLNQLSGSIPAQIGNCVKLQTLVMFSNQLSGAIPASIGNLVNLKYLQIFSNHLSGAIPAEIGNLTSLIDLSLNDNMLSDSISAGIGNLANLRYLNLYNNQLSGTIPATLGNLTDCLTINLSNNHLSGAIPASLNKLMYPTRINLSYNRLSSFGETNFPVKKNIIGGSVSHNKLSFDWLHDIDSKFPHIQYAPQDTILPIHQDGNTLSVSAGGSVSNNKYTWHRAGTKDSIVIKGDSAFTPSASGMYYATVKNKKATRLTLYSDTIDFTMPAMKQSSNILIAKVMQSATIVKHTQVFPNPAKDIIHIQASGIADIMLINNAGKLLFTKTINSNATINVSAFASGIYYIKNKTTGEVEKIVVVH